MVLASPVASILALIYRLLTVTYPVRNQPLRHRYRHSPQGQQLDIQVSRLLERLFQNTFSPDSSDLLMKSSLAGNCADPLELCRVSSSAAQHSDKRQETTVRLQVNHLIVIECAKLDRQVVKTYVQVSDRVVRMNLLGEEKTQSKASQCFEMERVMAGSRRGN
jgi:hypothetical protein